MRATTSFYMGAYDHDDRIVLQNPGTAEPDEIDLVVYAAPAGTPPATSWTSTRRRTLCASSCAVADRTPTSPGGRDALAIMIAGQW